MNIGTLILSSVVANNAAFVNGFGLVGVIPHKKNTVFMLISNLMIMVMSIICSAAYYVFYNYVFIPLNLEELLLFAITLIVLLVDFIAMLILRSVGAEIYYHYEKNFTFVVHAIVVLGLALTANIALEFHVFMISVFMQFVGFFIVNVIFFALNSRINNRTLPDQVRALPPQLALMGVLALIGYLILGLAL